MSRRGATREITYGQAEIVVSLVDFVPFLWQIQSKFTQIGSVSSNVLLLRRTNELAAAPEAAAISAILCIAAAAVQRSEQAVRTVR